MKLIACRTDGLQAGVIATLQPPCGEQVSVSSSLQIDGPRLSIFLNTCRIRTTVQDASVRAYCSVYVYYVILVATPWPNISSEHSRPIQILGPPLNGRNPHPGFMVSHLSGRNSFASSPQISLRLCITQIEQLTVWPFLTKIGELPSAPPPLGRTVSVVAVRALFGTTGQRRRAKTSQNTG